MASASGAGANPVVRPLAYAPHAETSGRWLVGFVVFHCTCQLLLLVPGVSALRVLVRMGAFGSSIALLIFIPAKAHRRPVMFLWAIAILAIIFVEFLHPDSGGLLASIAQFMLNLAILAPVFWVPRVRITEDVLQRLVLILWAFYTASAVVGVLQSYFPGRFEPPLSTVISDLGRDAVATLQIQLTTGERMFRPMGLTDTPGGAAYGGMYSVLLGAGVLLLPKSPFIGARFAALGSMVAGLMCIYLCQVRSIVVMVGVCMVVMIALLVVSGRGSRLLGLLGAVAAVIPGAFLLALSLGGRSMTDRLSTLIESDVGSVYYTHRGHFLETTINDYLPQFPLGAGLGRWGMVYRYFGSGNNLWVEIQWTGWLFDGGVPLVLVYSGALLATTWACFKIARGRLGNDQASLSVWGAVFVAYNVGAIALCFNYPFFIGTSGLEFWLLNTALVCAAMESDSARHSAVL